MVRIQRHRLSEDHLKNRLEYLEEMLNVEEDMLSRLNLIQARINVMDAIEEFQRI